MARHTHSPTHSVGLRTVHQSMPRRSPISACGSILGMTGYASSITRRIFSRRATTNPSGRGRAVNSVPLPDRPPQRSHMRFSALKNCAQKWRERDSSPYPMSNKMCVGARYAPNYALTVGRLSRDVRRIDDIDREYQHILHHEMGIVFSITYQPTAHLLHSMREHAEQPRALVVIRSHRRGHRLDSAG